MRAIDTDGSPKLSRKGAKGVSTFRAECDGMRGVNYRPLVRRDDRPPKDGQTSAADELYGRARVGILSVGEGIGTATM